MARFVNRNDKKGTKNPARTQTQTETAGLMPKAANSAKEFTQFMGCLMRDVITGNLTPHVASAVCNAAGKILKVAEMQHRYGTKKSRFDVLSLR